MVQGWATYKRTVVECSRGNIWYGKVHVYTEGARGETWLEMGEMDWV